MSNYFNNLKLVYNFRESFGEHIYKLYNGIEFIGIIGCVDRKDYCQISTLFVEKNYRKKGYASLLINNVFQQQKDKGCKIIYVNSTKDAIKFYKKHGFVHTGSMNFIDKYIRKLDRAQFYKRLN